MLCLALSPSVTVLTASRLVITKVATPSQQDMANSSPVTKPSSQRMVSSRDTSHRPNSSNRLLLLTLLRLLVPMGSLQQTNMASKVDHPVTTSPAITVSILFLLRCIFLILLRLMSLSTTFHGYVMHLCSSSADNYRQDGQGGTSGYSSSESSRYPGGSDNRGPGRDGFDRGGVMHRGRGGMGRGMG